MDQRHDPDPADQHELEEAVEAQLRLRGELHELVVRREVEYTSLRGHVYAFQARYLDCVGFLQPQLAQLEAEICAARALLQPRDGTLAAAAAAARAFATQASDELAALRRAACAGAAVSVDDDEARELQGLYRAVCRLMHPALALEEGARARRYQLMLEAQTALRHGYAEAIERILEHYSEPGETEIELEHLKQICGQLQRRLTELESELRDLLGSVMHSLMLREPQARRHGLDLLRDESRELRSRIGAARRLLVQLQTGGTRPQGERL